MTSRFEMAAAPGLLLLLLLPYLLLPPNASGAGKRLILPPNLLLPETCLKTASSSCMVSKHTSVRGKPSSFKHPRSNSALHHHATHFPVALESSSTSQHISIESSGPTCLVLCSHQHERRSPTSSKRSNKRRAPLRPLLPHLPDSSRPSYHLSQVF